MVESLGNKPREGYQAGASEVIQYNWGGIITYLRIDFNVCINNILDFAQRNGCRGREIPLAEHILGLIYNAARNQRLGNVHHIRRNDRLDEISGCLQHYYEKIESLMGKKPPKISEIDLELVAHEFIYSIGTRNLY